MAWKLLRQGQLRREDWKTLLGPILVSNWTLIGSGIVMLVTGWFVWS
ncbi:hypothetical protein [Consotaella aegiceratis]